MDGNISPEKVKQLLSSFLVTTHANGKDKTPVHTKVDGNISTQDEPGPDYTLPSACSSSSNLRSFKKFLERLDSFSVTWFGKPLDLSPIICARNGWENVDCDMLQCVGCKAFLSGQLPSKIDFDSYEESLSKLKKSLHTSHDKFCVLAANPCPEHFCHVPVNEPIGLLSSFADRVRSINKIQEKLPNIDEADLQVQGYDIGQGGAYCKRNLVPDVEASPEAVALAFTGWTCCASNEEVLTCSMCRRHVGLWNFASHSSNLSKKAADDGDESLEEGQVMAKKRKLCVKDSLNPVGEHHHWCPWTQESLLTSPPPTSSGAASQSPADKTLLSAPTYIVALRTIAPGLMDNNKGLASTMKTSPMVEGLRYFRRVIRAWSSPKVQMTSSPS